MEKLRTEDAVGMPLCHDITAMRPGFKGPLFRRGHIITREDIPELLDLGKKTVYVGEIGEGMLHEEECAKRLAVMIPVEGAHYEGPSEGKMSLVSDRRGMLRLNRELLIKLNSLGDITITTLPDHYRVEEKARIASMRIVPLFTEEALIRKAEELCKDTSVLELLPYKSLNAGVVITGSEIFNGRIKDLFEPVVRRKLAYYPGKIIGVKICDDNIAMILSAAEELMKKGADFLIFSGGMSVDPDDLTPDAIRQFASEVISFGVPAQPGNMTMVAYRNEIPILGVPGAAIHLPVTIFDVLLPQIYTGLKFNKEDLIRLGEGGVCQMCTTCHYPNCSFGRY